MCILAGCDYLPSLPGLGIKKAWEFMERGKTASGALRLVAATTHMAVPQDYWPAFVKVSPARGCLVDTLVRVCWSLTHAIWAHTGQAEKTFKHQAVWCPKRDQLVRLFPAPVHENDLDFAGPLLDPAVAKGLVRGRINPLTFEPMPLPGYVCQPVGWGGDGGSVGLTTTGPSHQGRRRESAEPGE